MQQFACSIITDNKVSEKNFNEILTICSLSQVRFDFVQSFVYLFFSASITEQKKIAIFFYVRKLTLHTLLITAAPALHHWTISMSTYCTSMPLIKIFNIYFWQLQITNDHRFRFLHIPPTWHEFEILFHINNTKIKIKIKYQWDTFNAFNISATFWPSMHLFRVDNVVNHWCEFGIDSLCLITL